MNSVRLALIPLCAAVLAACTHTPLPVAQNFPATYQQKVRSAGHWQAVANHQMQALVPVLQGATAGSVQVTVPANATQFEQGLQTFAQTHLVQAGLPVAHSAVGNVAVSFETQVVRHGSPRPAYVPGQTFMVVAGLLSLGHIAADSTAGLNLATLLGAGALDAAQGAATGGPTSVEVVVVARITDGDRILGQQATVYYVEEADLSLFVRPSAPPPPPPLRTLNVVGS